MGATSQYRPDTRAPGGGGMDYNGNPVGGGMGAQFNMGGPRAVGGAYGQPIFGGSPLPGDLYNRGVNQIGQQIGVQPGGPGMIGQVLGRFQPRGMIPPAGGRIGNPRQVNPGQGPMQPGRPGGVDPGFGYPMPSPGGGKGGMPGPGGPVIDDMRYKGPPMFIDGNGNPTNDHGGGAFNMNINPFNPAYRDN